MPKITPQVSNIGQGREGVGHTIATTTTATTNITRVMPATFQVAIRSILHRFAQKMSGFASCFVFSNALTKAFVSRLWITWLKARKNADFADFGSFFVCSCLFFKSTACAAVSTAVESIGRPMPQ